MPLASESEFSALPNAHLQVDAVVNMVRLYTRDHPELNRLISGVESSNRQIAWAIMDTLDDFNTEPPTTGYNLSNFPSMSLLIRGVTCSLLESIGLLQTRNHLSFSDGGIQIGVNDKTPFIQSWLQMFRNSYEDKKRKMKQAANIENAWGGGVSSELKVVNNYYGWW